MANNLLRNALLVNEGQVSPGDILLKNGRIERIGPSLPSPQYKHEEFDCGGHYLLPGCIDDQVHFREPGLTHKADIYSESRAAAAGGVTSFMEMPNTNPQAVTQELLEEKYRRAAETSLVNYSFYMGATNDNLEELKHTDPTKVCGLKIFAGSSTGNMLVDQQESLEAIFRECPHLIAVHSESEQIIRKNTEAAMAQYGEDIPMAEHPRIRSAEACYQSTQKLVRLAEKHGTRLHVLHISTWQELEFFRNDIPLREKKITAEACVHHLWFSAEDYARLGGMIKCNPAIKDPIHREGIWEALMQDKIDVIATDHAPHTWDEKQGKYLQCPSGLPLVQHSLLMMLEMYHRNRISLGGVVEKMAHAPAELFRIKERGYLREGYKADLVLVDMQGGTKVSKENLLYKCGWSPLEGVDFQSKVLWTMANGRVVYRDGAIVESGAGERLAFEGV